MQVPGAWYARDSASSSSARPTRPCAACSRTLAFSLLDRPLGIGPPGTNTVGRWPKCSAPISRPGTILSQMPSISAASNTSWLSETAVAMAITSRENRLSSMPGVPCVTPSHMAGTPPATWAVAPCLRASSLMMSG